MAHAANTVTVNATEDLVDILEVADLLDNEYWSFCPDDALTEVATYTQFELGPEARLPAGTTVLMEYLWGWGPGGITRPTDYQVVLPAGAPVKHIVHFMMSVYQHRLRMNDAAGRYLFIEQVSMKDGVCVIDWGT